MTTRTCAKAFLCVALAACAHPIEVGSVGAVFARDNETRALHLREVPSGMPADAAGLLPGDEVLMIDGLYVRDLSAQQIREMLRGNVGSSVELTIVRGEEVRRIRLTRSAFRAEQEVETKKEETISE